MINQQVQMSNLANIVANLSKQNLCDVAQNEQSNKKVIKNKETTNIDFKINRDFTDFYDLNYIEVEILNPFSKFQYNDRAINEEEISSIAYTGAVALGLAMREFKK